MSVEPIRIAASPDGYVTAIWHREYLSGLGDDMWGVIRLLSPFGLFDYPNIIEEVFERCLYVVKQRADGLLIDSRFFHHTWPDKVQTCLAGRGTEARQVSLGYFEGEYNPGRTVTQYVYCAGPGRDKDRLRAMVVSDIDNEANMVVQRAAQVVSAGAGRPRLETTSLLQDLQHKLQEENRRNRRSMLAPNIRLSTVNFEVLGERTQWTYEDWTRGDSPLTDQQRSILESDLILEHPIRLLGPAGSGKTLLMQLLAVRRLREASFAGRPVRILYVVHSTAMAALVTESLTTLAGTGYLEADSTQRVWVGTLARYIEEMSQVEQLDSIGPDMESNRTFQEQCVQSAIQVVSERQTEKCNLLQISRNPDTLPILARLIAAEIAVAIKGHDLTDDQRGYVESEKKLSLLHGGLAELDRRFVYAVFLEYHRELSEVYEVLDSDDLALTMLGLLRTPLWQLKQRQTGGFDFVFVDEAQLFNDNERRLFPYLTKGDSTHLPLALAMDHAQELRGAITAGLGLLGIEHVHEVKLDEVHRSSQSILNLAFSLLQRTTALFHADLPDFTTTARGRRAHKAGQFAKPTLIRLRTGDEIGAGIVGQVRRLRSANIWSIGIIIYAPHLRKVVEEALRNTQDLRDHVLFIKERGVCFDRKSQWIAIGEPEFVGGQEFDGVIAVGIERGSVPPRVRAGNASLAAALDETALRSMYLGFTRARDALLIVNSPGSEISQLLEGPVRHKLVVVEE